MSSERTVFCRKCRAPLETGRPFCPSCFTVVERRSIARRMLDRFVEWCGRFLHTSDGTAAVSGPVFRTTISVKKSSRIVVHDKNTGERREYSSLDDVPDEYRTMLESLDGPDNLPANESAQSISIRGNDGVKRTYSSLDDVPPDMRRLIDRFMNS